MRRRWWKKFAGRKQKMSCERKHLHLINHIANPNNHLSAQFYSPYEPFIMHCTVN